MAVSPELLAGLQNHQAGRLASAEQLYRQVLADDPNNADALQLLGLIAFDHGQQENALELIGRAIELNGSRSDFFNNLGNVLSQQGRLDDALGAYQRALELKPDNAEARSNLLLALQYRAGVTLAELAAAHAEFEKFHAAPLLNQRLPQTIDLDPDRRLTVGFVSPNFRQHPVGHFVIQALENLERDRFQVNCYSDGAIHDDWTRRFKTASAVWWETAALTDLQLAEQIHSDRVDILFDLAGHTAKNRLLAFARRPAPIQITWADYVGTTGLTAIDYILADRYEIPTEAEAGYVERVLRMPHGYVCYDPPAYAPAVSALPALSRGFVTFGSFNIWPKMALKIIDVWAQILRRVPGSRLMLKNGMITDAYIREPLLNEFANRGIARERIDCLGWSAHEALLAEYQRIDLALDPYPYNGGLTTCEATWMGVPVITCPGETFASRHSLSHLSNVGLTETIAGSLDDYVERAVSLAANLPRLAALRSGLRDRMAVSPLCDGKRFARDLTSLLRQVWRQCCEGDQNR